MKKRNPFFQKIINIVERFNKTEIKTPQEVSRLLFAHILSYRGHQTHGGLKVDAKTWRRLKAIQKRAQRMRADNTCHRTNGKRR